MNRTLEEIKTAYAQYRKEKTGYEPTGPNADVIFLLEEIERLRKEIKRLEKIAKATAIAMMGGG